MGAAPCYHGVPIHSGERKVSVIITGSVLVVDPDSEKEVLQALEAFPEVTFQVKSESGTELVVNLEVQDQSALDRVCGRLKESIPQIIDISHIYVNFEEEVEEMLSKEGKEASQDDPEPQGSVD